MRFRALTLRIASASLAAFTFMALSTQAALAQRYELDGSRIAIYNLAGEVTLEAGSGSSVTVQVETGGPDGGELRVETGTIGDWETLRVLYPADQIIYQPPDTRGRTQTSIRVRQDGTFGDHGHGRRRGRRVEIRSSGRGFEGYADLTIRVPRGQRLTVHLGAGAVTASNLDGSIVIDTHSGNVTATSMRGTLTIDTGSGSIELTDAEGDVNLDTGSGSVDASGVTGPRLRIDTGSGSVVASDVTVTTLDIDTGSGNVRVTNASADDVVLDTGSGSVEAAFTARVENVEIDTGSGGVTLTLPEDFGAVVDIETGSGGIELEFPVEVRRWERDHVRGTIGDGSGRLVIDTGSGTIRIRKG